jgi:hypothetical protein
VAHMPVTLWLTSRLPCASHAGYPVAHMPVTLWLTCRLPCGSHAGYPVAHTSVTLRVTCRLPCGSHAGYPVAHMPVTLCRSPHTPSPPLSQTGYPVQVPVQPPAVAHSQRPFSTLKPPKKGQRTLKILPGSRSPAPTHLGYPARLDALCPSPCLPP